MRIIAGRLGGRIFEAPHGHHTHPMGDRVRGGLFNTLGDIEGLNVLDAFAGSGALGFEAVSRGATSVVAIENDKAAQQSIASNIRTLGVDDTVRLVRASANAWLTTTDEQFDLVLCDPPYDRLQLPLLQKLAGRVRPGGIFVASWPGKQPVPAFAGLELIAERNYGDAQLSFWRAS